MKKIKQTRDQGPETRDPKPETALSLATTVLALSLFATVPVIAQNNAAPDVLLQRAIQKEMVDGDLPAAIELYKQIVAARGASRSVTATGLLRLGQAYEKLGSAEARKAYERVTTEFADQKEAAAEARARLAKTETDRRTDTMASRLVWTPASGQIHHSVSHDGRYVPYTDWNETKGRADLFLHDLVSGDHRRLTANDIKNYGNEFAGEVTFSRDAKQLAYSWFNKNHNELRVLDLVRTGAQPRVLFDNGDVSRITPDDWSPSGKWLAVQLQRKDQTAQIGLIAVQDGSLRFLKSVDWRGATKLFFSPDSRYLAYDLPVNETGNQREIFILAIDGSREIAAVVSPGNHAVMGWSPDAKRLLFASDRGSSTGLWSLNISDGKPQGAPEPIKVDFAGTPMGISHRGDLYTKVNYPNFSSVVRSDIHVANFDFAKDEFVSEPVAPVLPFAGANGKPSWSPDGKYLAFISRRPEQGSEKNNVIAIHSPETGEVRELRTGLQIYAPQSGFNWSPDGLWLALYARDSKGRLGIFRVNARTGETSPIAFDVARPAWSPDGKKIYFNVRRQSPMDWVIVERDLVSKNERDVARGLTKQILATSVLSPDGRHFAAFKETTLVLIPTGGGDLKELMRADQPKGASEGGPSMAVLMWAPDSRSVFVTRSASDKHREVWRVALDGRQPRMLDLNIGGMFPEFSVHPNGRQVAIAVQRPAKQAEVWVLENFLPTLTASK